MSSLTLLCDRALLISSREYTDPVISVIIVRIIILLVYLHCILTSFLMVLQAVKQSEVHAGPPWLKGPLEV